ncbi:FtsH protease activity modulator HflK [Methylocella sp. CPCC 101449]|uniref:FtsH protease activity modulator HflK n=1 Tax=Methylocella sp. CPCC 101449 TaxID=2987531 RepID=UPI0028900D4D|nr:FtsH protease activity modulator HflK [Methylocella sp. CPCC 101449]MDT2023329.1 FtsH protease activity modulator HflK [Methylocella sp. CPCC 101449]HEV2574137.1 FtsH protease activity modulator HflK [Beijerinckiaceae bacterium]
MPWNNQSGGGGPWRPNNNPGPWGQGPSGSGGPGGPTPDLEELLRRSQDRLKQVVPGGFMGGAGFALVAAAAAAIWLASGIYTVQPNEAGLEMVFGRFTNRTENGLRYNWPAPIGSVIKLRVTDRNSIDIGFRTREDPRRPNNQTQSDVPEESLMLTGDENIANVKFRVIWQIDPTKPEEYAFNVRDVRETIKAVSESAMREIVGRTQIQKILTAERKVIEPAAQELTQRVLNDYKAGVQILQVQLLSVDPPDQVIAAFRDVTAAQQDLDRLRNEAEAYANRVVPEARGSAARILQEADAYREQTVAEARGQASRFTQVYEQYRNAPDVTRERMYLETMERVLAGANKIILDQSAGQGQGGVVPVLPLGQLLDSSTASGAATQAPTQPQGARR